MSFLLLRFAKFSVANVSVLVSKSASTVLRCSMAMLVILLVFTSGCASVNQEGSNEVTDAADPWEGMNRAIFSFNDTLDGYVLKPVAKGYRAVTPNVAEAGVSNFFSNLTEIRNVVNDVLQWKWGQAGKDSGRFLINSTLGVAGLFDVASHMSLERSEGEDFAQTLAKWGVGRGPYLVLPLMGPSTLRGAAGMPADWYLDPISHIDHNSTRYSAQVFNIIVDRANLLTAEEFVSGDRYLFIREAYLQRREYLVNDGETGDEFGDDFGDDFGSDYEDFE